MSERKAIPAKLRDKVLREAGYRCANPPCRTTLAIHLHHVIVKEIRPAPAQAPNGFVGPSNYPGQV